MTSITQTERIQETASDLLRAATDYQIKMRAYAQVLDLLRDPAAYDVSGADLEETRRVLLDGGELARLKADADEAERALITSSGTLSLVLSR